MTEQPMQEVQPDTLQPQLGKSTEEAIFLKQIAEHLKSIRSMLSFFVVLTILAVIIQACSILM